MEGVYQDGNIKMSDGSNIKIKSTCGSAIVDIVQDSMVNGHQTLVFAETRKCTSYLAKKVEGIVYKSLNESIRKMALEESSKNPFLWRRYRNYIDSFPTGIQGSSVSSRRYRII